MGQYKTKRKKQLGNCVVCTKEFLKYSKRSKYCSEECATAKPIKPPPTCVVCNCEVKDTRTKYCSEECFKESRRRQHRKGDGLSEPKQCLECGNDFIRTSSSNLYCGFKCKEIARKKAKKQNRSRPEVREKIREYDKKRYASLDDRTTKNRNLVNCYGITIEEYESMLAKQKGLCGICYRPPTGLRPLCVDHCHTTGKVRALLCLMCNNLLGNARESKRILRNAESYVDFHGCVEIRDENEIDPKLPKDSLSVEEIDLPSSAFLYQDDIV